MLLAKDSPYILQIHYEDAKSFLKAISYGGDLYGLFNEHFVFRGHSSDKYLLLPSALRGNMPFESEKINPKEPKEITDKKYALGEKEQMQVHMEYKFLQDFFNQCDCNGLYVPEVDTLRNSFYPGIDGETLLLAGPWLSKQYWELAALAQHHGVKTRLLDWTQDLFVALYFASTGVYNDPQEEKDVRMALDNYRQGKPIVEEHDMEIWALNIDVVMAKPAQMPLKIIRPKYHSNDNLCAQKGLFTFWEIHKQGFIDEETGELSINKKTDKTPLDVQLTEYLKQNNVPQRIYLYRITIPRKAAKEIYAFVERHNYNASTIFPGYDGVVRFLKEHKDIL